MSEQMFWELRVRRMVLEWLEVRARFDAIEAIAGRLASDLLAYDPANCPVGRLRVGTVSPSARAKTLAAQLEELGSQMTPLLEALYDLRNVNNVGILPEVLEGAAVRADLDAMSAKIGDVRCAAEPGVDDFVILHGGSTQTLDSECDVRSGDCESREVNADRVVDDDVDWDACGAGAVDGSQGDGQRNRNRVLGHCSSSSVRCVCCARLRDVGDTSHLTGEGSPSGGISSTESEAASEASKNSGGESS